MQGSFFRNTLTSLQYPFHVIKVTNLLKLKRSNSQLAKKRNKTTIGRAVIARERTRNSITDLKRIENIIRNARASWFALLGALVFAAITLASVKDVSFFVPDIQTKLPLVGISVPINSFFWAGSLLIATFYIYFHLYLEQLWQALGEAEAQIEGRPLADCIYPWIVSDTALRMRDKLRRAEGNQRASRNRGMGFVSTGATIGLVWMFGLLVVLWFWWRSMPAHEPTMTSWLGVIFAATSWVALASYGWAQQWLSGRKQNKRRKSVIGILALILMIGGFTTTRTWIDPFEGTNRTAFPRDRAFTDVDGTINEPTFYELTIDYFFRPARAKLQEIVIQKIPEDWSDRESAFKAFFKGQCSSYGLECANFLREYDLRREKWNHDFFRTWENHWSDLQSKLKTISLRNRDLRGADFRRAQLVGVDLSGSRLDGANFSRADLRHAEIAYARIRGAYFYRTNLSFTNFDYSDLSFSVFWRANLVGARFMGALIFGQKEISFAFRNAIIHNVYFKDTAFRHVILTMSPQAHPNTVENSFGDGSTAFLRRDHSYLRPSRWCDKILNHKDYHLAYSKSLKFGGLYVPPWFDKDRFGTLGTFKCPEKDADKFDILHEYSGYF